MHVKAHESDDLIVVDVTKIIMHLKRWRTILDFINFSLNKVLLMRHKAKFNCSSLMDLLCLDGQLIHQKLSKIIKNDEKSYKYNN